MRQRWVFTDQPFLPIDPPTVLLNRIWNYEQLNDEYPGQLPVPINNYAQDARWKLPALKFTGHMCHPDWLVTGEPWPVPSTLPPTVYLVGWIPECCVMACVNDDCKQDPVNGQPASQAYQYAIDAKDATGTTPAWAQLVADAITTGGGDWRGEITQYNHNGIDNPPAWSNAVLVQPDGTPYSRTDAFHIDPANTFDFTEDASGATWDITQAGTAFSMTLRALGAVGQLSGTNLTIAPALLPPNIQYRGSGTVAGIGTTQAGAAVLAPGSWDTTSSGPTQRAFRLDNVVGSTVDVYPGPTNPQYIYPPVGENFAGLAVNAPIIVTQAGPPYYAFRFTRTGATTGLPASWSAEQYDASGTAPSGGTVTSVGISTSSGGVAVGGGPIVGAGTLTVDIAPDLNNLVGFTALNAILCADGAGHWAALTIGSNLALAGTTLNMVMPAALTSLIAASATTGLKYVSAANTWSGVTVGDYLDFTAGTLKSVPPTATGGLGVVGAFPIPAAPGVFNATGWVAFAISAGTYSIRGQFRGALQPGAGGQHFITVKLRNNTAGAFVANSEVLVVSASQVGVLVDATASFEFQVTVTVPTTFEIYATENPIPAPVQMLMSDANGRSTLCITKLF